MTRHPKSCKNERKKCTKLFSSQLFIKKGHEGIKPNEPNTVVSETCNKTFQGSHSLETVCGTEPIVDLW